MALQLSGERRASFAPIALVQDEETRRALASASGRDLDREAVDRAAWWIALVVLVLAALRVAVG